MREFLVTLEIAMTDEDFERGLDTPEYWQWATLLDIPSENVVMTAFSEREETE